MTVSNVQNVLVKASQRVVAIPIDKDKSKDSKPKFWNKKFLDVFVITRYATGKIHKDHFICHYYRAQLRIVLQADDRLKYSEKESVTLDQFIRYAQRRWKNDWQEVVNVIDEWRKQ